MSDRFSFQDPSSTDNAQQLQEFVTQLSLDPDREPVLSELGVLQSIYGDDAVIPWKPPQPHGDNSHRSDGTIRYELHVNLPPPHDDLDERLRVLVSLPPSYPVSASPQFQLLSRYIGAFGVDSALFGSILRTYISRDGVEWIPDTVCVFDGMENVRERCAKWYSDHLSKETTNELLRQDGKERRGVAPKDSDQAATPPAEPLDPQQAIPPPSMPDGVKITEAEAITDRKSAFVGRACRITDPSQVPRVLTHLMSDRRIARAAHPVINAWRCKVDGVIHQDNGDDGETAAGGRLAHLLQILDVDNVLVVVTRYFGGIHLGPDRFKHINQAARNALELGGFLDTLAERSTSSRIRKKV